MRTTTLIALIGTASATTKAPAATLAADCKTKNDKCTADLCWTDKKFNKDALYTKGCAGFDSAADKCTHGGVCTAETCWTAKVFDSKNVDCKAFDTAADKCTHGDVCTAATCWSDKKFSSKVTGCKDFDTDADKCLYGNATTDKDLCTNAICAGKTETNCHTCLNAPFTSTCWSASDASDKCMWGKAGCTVDLCKGNESIDAVATRPA